MLFYLTTLNLTKFLIEIIPKSSENKFDCTIYDFMCKNYILNSLDNTLHDMYSLIKSAKVLWKTLHKQYKVENVGTKKFIAKQFLNSKIVDSMIEINQVKEFKLILHNIHVEGIYVNESF